MDAARELFKKLQSFKETKSSEKELLAYCKKTLGSIERYHFDFKQKRNRSNSTLENDDKKNLAKAVSGFANSGGGVLIWGIKDKTITPKPIDNVSEFVSSIMKLAPQTTDPRVPDIDGDWIPSKTDSGKRGFGLILIPESLLPPHRVVIKHKEINNHYYFRSGESFLVASHTQLEDMFGRRPKPKLCLHSKVIKYGSQPHVIIGIENKGRGIAKYPFLSVKVHHPYKISRHGINHNGRFGLDELASTPQTGEKRYGSSSDKVIHSSIIHDVTSVIIETIGLSETITVEDLILDYQITAEGINPITGTEVIKASELLSVLSKSE